MTITKPSSMLLDYDYVMYQWAENGWQNIGMKDTFVKAPTALQGRKIRSQEAEIHLATWKAFGASPVEMPFEVLQSLNTGRVDGLHKPHSVRSLPPGIGALSFTRSPSTLSTSDFGLF